MKACFVLALTLVASPAFCQTLLYDLSFAGPSSPGVGTGLVTVDTASSMMRVQAEFSGLTGATTAAHIHCCTAAPFSGDAGVASPTPTFPGFPSGVTSGSYDMTFDMTDAASYNGSFITNNGGTPAAAFNALLNGFDGGNAYLNIHTSTFGGGEIRAFLTLIPEPTSAALAVLAIAALGGRRARAAAQAASV